MVKGHRQEAWDHSVALICTVIGLVRSEPLDPLAVHPCRHPPPRTEADKARHDREGWRMLDAAMTQIARGNRPRRR